MKEVNLSKFSNAWYKPGNSLKRIFWHILNVVFFKSALLYPNIFKVFLLRIFGAKIGKNLVIKHSVNIKYPWFLEIGDNAWVGEGVWIDNLTDVKIGKNVCISQGAYIFTGSHNYKRSTFDLLVKNITIEDGTWIGAKAIVSPGVKCGSHSVLTAGSVAISDLEPYKIYQGNPAVYKRDRTIQE